MERMVVFEMMPVGWDLTYFKYQLNMIGGPSTDAVTVLALFLRRKEESKAAYYHGRIYYAQLRDEHFVPLEKMDLPCDVIWGDQEGFLPWNIFPVEPERTWHSSWNPIKCIVTWVGFLVTKYFFYRLAWKHSCLPIQKRIFSYCMVGLFSFKCLQFINSDVCIPPYLSFIHSFIHLELTQSDWTPPKSS